MTIVLKRKRISKQVLSLFADFAVDSLADGTILVDVVVLLLKNEKSPRVNSIFTNYIMVHKNDTLNCLTLFCRCCHRVCIVSTKLASTSSCPDRF